MPKAKPHYWNVVDRMPDEEENTGDNTLGKSNPEPQTESTQAQPEERLCANEKCKAPFRSSNPKKLYCSQKCNKKAYMVRRYRRDDKFNERMRNCWTEYGMDDCPKCHRPKRRSEPECRSCLKVDSKIDIRAMSGDTESLFGSPDGLLKMDMMMTVTSHPELTKEQLLDMFKDTADVPSKRIKELLEEIYKS